jgi:uroporphyrin-III C-methyltransferase/precorrin-2 dehydrogenase/sirohydrochlorin ferrochelatase
VRYFPVYVDLEGRRVLIAGGGEKAVQKLRLLVRTPAAITLIAEQFADEIYRIAAERPLTLVGRRFLPSDADGHTLVFSASDDPDVDAGVVAAAKARGIAVNVVDNPADCSFLMPAIVDRAPVTVAIGTEGAAPILARDLKAKIESWLPADFGRIAQRALALRNRIKSEISSSHARRAAWERLLKGTWSVRVLAGDETGAERELDRQLAAARKGQSAVGLVSLIGCGPGDPDLLTLRAQQRLQEADVLVIDRLVNRAILEYARRDALRIEVGKEGYGPSADQEDINRILIREALKGYRVARLKGGDPFVFARAAEEMVAVRAAGIEVEVVPGITAAHAAAASIELPLTLREKIRRFTILTGASADAGFDLDWASLAEPGQAFAIYMGVRSAPRLRDKLIAAGARPGTPVIIVENATLPDERVIETVLADLPAAIAAKSIHGPAVIFVGLDWSAAQLSRPAKVDVFRAGGAIAADAGKTPLRAPARSTADFAQPRPAADAAPGDKTSS